MNNTGMTASFPYEGGLIELVLPQHRKVSGDAFVIWRIYFTSCYYFSIGFAAYHFIIDISLCQCILKHEAMRFSPEWRGIKIHPPQVFLTKGIV